MTTMHTDELGLSLTFERPTRFVATSPDDCGGNPALKVPTLHCGSYRLFGTANICSRLAEIAGGAHDSRIVISGPWQPDLLLNAQELVWTGMGTQVQLVLGLKVAGLPRESMFFERALRSLAGSLAWIEANLGAILAALPSTRATSMLEAALFCLVEHIRFRSTLPLDDYPRILEFAAEHARRDSAKSTPFRFDPPA
jgi:glutathione S-transferase